MTDFFRVAFATRRRACAGYLGSRASPTRFKIIAEEASADVVEFKFGEERAEGRLIARTDAEDFRLERQRDVGRR